MGFVLIGVVGVCASAYSLYMYVRQLGDNGAEAIALLVLGVPFIASYLAHTVWIAVAGVVCSIGSYALLRTPSKKLRSTERARDAKVATYGDTASARRGFGARPFVVQQTAEQVRAAYGLPIVGATPGSATEAEGRDLRNRLEREDSDAE